MTQDARRRAVKIVLVTAVLSAFAFVVMDVGSAAVATFLIFVAAVVLGE